MHMSDCLGGFCFYDDTFTEEGKIDEPRFIDQGKVSDEVFNNKETRILEINSKTGLYPLYVACFHVFVYNIQPGIIIDYQTGENRAA